MRVGSLPRVGPGARLAIAGLLLACLVAIAGLLGAGSAAGRPPAAGPAPAAPRAHASIGFEPTTLGVAVDAQGRVYLSNAQMNQQVQVYSTSGVLLGSRGNFHRSELSRTVAIGPEGDLYVADGASAHVVVFDPHGKELRRFPIPRGGDIGRGIAVEADGDVLLPVQGGAERFSPTGEPLSPLKAGSGTFYPYGLAVSSTGTVFAADPFGSKVAALDPSGGAALEWGEDGQAPGQLGYPWAVAAAPDGGVYVAESSNSRVQKFTADGHFVSSFGTNGSGRGKLDGIYGVAVDPAGYVYTVDSGEGYPDVGGARIEKWTGEGQFVTQWHEKHEPIAVPKLAARFFGKGHDGAEFRFSSAQKGVRFECNLNGRGVPEELSTSWLACASPHRYTDLAPGRKVFRVRAVKAGRAGFAAKREWKVHALG
jgi:streptogramin lyase